MLNPKRYSQRMTVLLGTGCLMEVVEELQCLSRREDIRRGNGIIRLYLLRHAQAAHNIACALRCPPEPREDVLRDDELFDAELSPKGHEQARIASFNLPPGLRAAVEAFSPSPTDDNSPVAAENKKKPAAALFYGFCSPLRRTMQTLSAAVPELRRVEMVECIREWAGGHACDARRNLSETKMMFANDFPDGVDVRSWDADEDNMPADVARESIEDVNKRCLTFLYYIATRVLSDISKFMESESSEVIVLAVSHAGFLRQLLAVMDVYPPAQRGFDNCHWKVIDLPLAPFLDWISAWAGEDLADPSEKRICSHVPPSLPLRVQIPTQFPLVYSGKEEKTPRRFGSMRELGESLIPKAPLTLMVYPPPLADDNQLEEELGRLADRWEASATAKLLSELAAAGGIEADVVLEHFVKLRNSPLAVRVLQSRDSCFQSSDVVSEWLRNHAQMTWVTEGWMCVRANNLAESVYESVTKERLCGNCVVVVGKWRLPDGLDSDDMDRYMNLLRGLSASPHVVEVDAF